MTIDDLPDELVDRIFDYAPLGLSDIVRASHVSARWRKIAHAHPTFCRYIDFACAAHAPHSAGLCARLRAQVGCSQVPLHLTIRYQGDDASVLQTLVSVLNDSMHRVVSLDLSLPVPQKQHIVTVLSQPAPQLTRLHVQARQLVSIWGRAITLPSALFGAGSRLEILSLYNVGFPASGDSTLPFLKDLTLHNHDPILRRDVEAALSACPQLRRLNFRINSVLGAAGDLGPLVEDVMHIPSVARLDNVGLHARKHIEASYAHIIPHLTGALHLELSDSKLEPNPSECSITLVEQRTGRLRRMAYQSLSLASRAAEIFTQLDLASRIVQLAVWFPFLDIPARLFPVLPCVKVLIIHLYAERDSDETPSSRTRTLAIDVVDETTVLLPVPLCPSLEKIVISGQEQQCSVRWLVEFMNTNIRLEEACGPDSRLRLELHGATLVGDPHSLQGHFSNACTNTVVGCSGS